MTNDATTDSDASWLEVRDARAAEQLYNLVRGYHDAIVVEANWIGREVIDERHRLIFGGRGDLTLRFQSQFNDVPPVELLLQDVQGFAYDHNLEAPPQINFAKDDLRVTILAVVSGCFCDHLPQSRH